MEGCIVEWLNWAKYQGEAKDYKYTSWLRCQVGLTEHDLWTLLDGDEFKAFMWLFLYTGRKESFQEGKLRITYATASRLSGVPAAKVRSAIEKLATAALDVVKVHPLAEPGSHPGHTPGTPRVGTGPTPGAPPANDNDNAHDHDHSADAASGAAELFEPLPELDTPLTRGLLSRIRPELQQLWVSLYVDVEWLKEVIGGIALHEQVRGSPYDDPARYVSTSLSKRDVGGKKKRKNSGRGDSKNAGTVRYRVRSTVDGEEYTVTSTRREYEKWVADFKAGRNSMQPPPLMGGA